MKFNIVEIVRSTQKCFICLVKQPKILSQRAFFKKDVFELLI